MSGECALANPSSTLAVGNPAKSADLFIFSQCGSKFPTNCKCSGVAPVLGMIYNLHCVRRTAERPNEVLSSMMKALTTLTAAATVAAALLAAPTDANAQWRRHG